MKMQIMRLRCEKHCRMKSRVYVDLWDEATQTGAEMWLSFPKDFVNGVYEALEECMHSKKTIDSGDLISLHHLFNAPTISEFVEQIVKGE